VLFVVVRVVLFSSVQHHKLDTNPIIDVPGYRDVVSAAIAKHGSVMRVEGGNTPPSVFLVLNDDAVSKFKEVVPWPTCVCVAVALLVVDIVSHYFDVSVCAFRLSFPHFPLIPNCLFGLHVSLLSICYFSRPRKLPVPQSPPSLSLSHPSKQRLSRSTPSRSW